MLQTLSTRFQIPAIFALVCSVVLFGCSQTNRPDASSVKPATDQEKDASSTNASARDGAEAAAVGQAKVSIATKDNSEVPEFPGSLGIGDPAPPVHFSSFFTGDAVHTFDRGRIYVVEFWATWCPPCRTSMPHLSKLQQLYGDDVTFIGVTRESQEDVGPFLASVAEGEEERLWADVVKYRLAEDKNGWTTQSYMKPAGQAGIPAAFIVGKDGCVEWIGHPMAMDEPLKNITAGKWNRKLETKKLAIRKSLFDDLRSQKWDEALKNLDALEKLSPDDAELPMLRFAALQSAERYGKAKAAAEQVLTREPADEAQLNMLAWNVVTEFPEDERDLDLALKLAQKANTLTDGNSPAVLDTLARVHYERAELEEAVSCQEKAALYGEHERYDGPLQKYRDEKDKPDIPETLRLGDAAPAVYAAEWYTGSPLEAFEDGKVYVVEFWATWCGPCLASMPHMSKLQAKYGDEVTFIGMTAEDKDVVEPFLEKTAPGQDGATWAEIVTYRLAQDRAAGNERRGWTSQSYMQAADQAGIPTAFIVGQDGRLQWIGHPMEIDKPLEQIVDGDWDLEFAIAEFETKARVGRAMAKVSKRLGDAQRARDWDGVLAALAEVEDELGDDAEVIFATKFAYLARAEKYEDALAVAKEIAGSDATESSTFNRLAWGIATEFPDDARDLDFARQMAEKANEMTDESSHQVIDTLARVYFEMGDHDLAIEWQSKAVELGGEPYQASLDKFKAAKVDADKPLEEKPSAKGEDGTEEAEEDGDGEPTEPGEQAIEV